MVASRQALQEEAAHLPRLSRDAQGEGPRHRAGRHARSLARAAHDRRRRSPAPMSTCRSRSASTSSKARPCWPPRASTARGAGGHAAAQHAAPGRGARPRHQAGQARARSAWSRSAATTTCAPPKIRPIPIRRPNLDYEMWTGPAPMRPYNTLVHPRSWRAFMEYGNGIVGDMCIHMFDMVRWMLGSRLAQARRLDRRHPGRQGEQGQHLRHADRHLRLRRPEGRLAAPHLGRRRPIPSTPGARRSTATRER